MAPATGAENRQSKTMAGRVAIVTGASRGIGKVVALAYAREGASVVVAARSAAPGKLPGTIYTTAEEVRALGAGALAMRCDVSVPEEVAAMVEATVREFGRVDVLVNNAGVFFPGYEVWKLPLEMWDYTVAVNLRGMFLCCKAVLPHMIGQRRGSIINVTSLGAKGSALSGRNLAYGATKAAIERFTLGLAAEAKKYNVAVNAISPVMLKTEGAIAVNRPDFDWSGFSPPEAIGPAMVFLASQDASTFTGRVVSRPEFGVTWP